MTVSKSPDTPSLTPPRPWYVPRVSLRTLLVVLTLCCVLAAYLANGPLKQRTAVRHFHALAANRPGPHTVTVIYRHDGRDDYFRPRIRWWLLPLSNLIGPEAFGNPVGIDLSSTEATDTDLRYFAMLPNVEYVILNKTQITEAGLRQLNACPRLRQLRLDETAITNDELSVISGLTNLEVLSLKNTAITDEGLTHLATLPKLKHLLLRDTGVTTQGCRKLQARLPGCDIDIIKVW